MSQFAPQAQQKRHRKISLKERAFLKAYFETQDATKAAIAIGCTEKSARTTGYRMLQRAHVQEQIEAELEKHGLSATYVLESLKGIADHEKTRNADRISALTLLGKHLRLFAEQMDVNITHDLADRVAQARARVTERNGTALVPKLLTHDTDQ